MERASRSGVLSKTASCADTPRPTTNRDKMLHRRHSLNLPEQLPGHYSRTTAERTEKATSKKLYTRAQLNHHVKTGDSEVDGSEVERSGFAGHPMCEFCKTPFYGDNELYTHMFRATYAKEQRKSSQQRAV